MLSENIANIAFAALMCLATVACAIWGFISIRKSSQVLLRPTYFVRKTKVKRHIASLVSVVLAAVFLVESVVSIGDYLQYRRELEANVIPDVSSDHDVASMPRATQLEDSLLSSSKDESDPLPAVDLTAEQIEAALEGFSFKFSTDSLASLALDRTEDIKALGENFTDAVSFPWMKLYERLDDIRSGKLAGAELEAFYEELRHDLSQAVISNPVLGYMILDAFSKIPAITANNPWIFDELDKFKELLQSEGGISNLVYDTYDGSGVKIRLVKQEYRVLAAKINCGLGFFEIVGVTTRTSVKNWHMPVILEDNLSHAEEADYQEFRASLLLVYRNKDGSEGIAIGFNVFDWRIEIFGKNTPETVPATTPEPEPEKTPDPTPTLPDPTPTKKPDPTPTPVPTLPDPINHEITVNTWFYRVGGLIDGKPPFPVDHITVEDKASFDYTAKPKTNWTAKPGRLHVDSVTGDMSFDIVYTKKYVPTIPTTPVVPIVPVLPDEPDKPTDNPPPDNPPPDNPPPDNPPPDNPPPEDPPEDGNGGKEPAKDPVNQDHADIGGGANPPGEDEEDRWQDADPDSGKDYPTQDQNPNQGSNADHNNDNTVSTPLTPNDPQDSSGLDGNDHPIHDSEGGYTEGGDVPDKNPLPDGNDETWFVKPGTGTSSGNGSTTTNPPSSSNSGGGSSNTNPPSSGNNGNSGGSTNPPPVTVNPGNSVNDDGGAFEL